jgi:hypothetical protein
VDGIAARRWRYQDQRTTATSITVIVYTSIAYIVTGGINVIVAMGRSAIGCSSRALNHRIFGHSSLARKRRTGSVASLHFWFSHTKFLASAYLRFSTEEEIAVTLFTQALIPTGAGVLLCGLIIHDKLFPDE